MSDQEWIDKGFSPSEAIKAAELDGATATATAPKVQPAKPPATAKQGFYYVRSLYNASLKGVKNGDDFNVPAKLKSALLEFAADAPEALTKGQNPPDVEGALSGQVCVWIIKKGARKGKECANDQKVMRINGSPLCANHAKAVQAMDVTAKALNESPDGEDTVQSANVKADKGPATEALL